MGKAYPAVEGQQDGVALDVPVYDALGVQVSQGLQHGLAHSGDLLLVQPGQGRQGRHQERENVSSDWAAGQMGWEPLVPGPPAPGPCVWEPR